ncbi:MAG: NAD-dependent epimerase/dehydratase family protein, partial [Actinomycetes bacterium]
MAVDDRPTAAVPILRDQRILVIGPMSSVGTPVVRALATDNRVWGASRFRRDRGMAELEAQGVHPVRFDLADPDLAALPDDIDYLVNFAVSHAPDFATALASNAENLGLLI